MGLRTDRRNRSIIPISQSLVERIAYVGRDASHTIDQHTRVIDASGKYLVPGLLDAHMHVESGMLTVTEFVRAIIPHGTTGIFIDPHEIANVFGLRGVKLMVDEAAHQPIARLGASAFLRTIGTRDGISGCGAGTGRSGRSSQLGMA